MDERSAAAFAFLHERRQGGHDLEQVADDPEIAELEDRGVRVFVDRHDESRAAHSDLVLDGARDPDGDVQLRRNGLAGLAHLMAVRYPSCIDDGTRRSDGTAERFCELLDDVEVLGPAEPATAGDDDARFIDAKFTGFLRDRFDDLRRIRLAACCRDRLHLALARLLSRGEAVRPADDDAELDVLESYRRDDGAAELRRLDDDRTIGHGDVGR